MVIAKQQGEQDIYRNTVRKYLRDGVKYGNTSRKSRGSKLDPYKDTVSELVESGLTSTPAIMERIVPLGYSGKETTLRNFIRSIRPPRSVQVAVRRYETKPGEQLQFDWGILPFVNKDGKMQTCRVLSPPSLILRDATHLWFNHRLVRYKS